MPVSEHHDPPPSQPLRPNPPRYWWLKRILLAFGVLIVALIALRWWWGHVAQRRLAATIAEYRAAGQPVLPEDFARPPVPDEDNAAYYLRQAAGAIAAVAPRTIGFDEISSDPPLALEYPEHADKLMADNAQALRLLRRARLAPECDWAALPDASGLNSMTGMYGGLRSLAKLGCAAAVVAHHRGDDAAAVEYLHDALSVAERCDQAGLLISHLVAVAIDAVVARDAAYIAAALGTDAAAPQRAGPSAVLRQRVDDLIARLTDDQRFRQAWRYTVLTERAYALAMLRPLFDATGSIAGPLGPTPPIQPWLVRVAFGPRWRLQAAQMLEELDRLADLAAVDNLPQARARIPRLADNAVLEWPPDPLRMLLDPWSNGGCYRSFVLHMRAVALARMAATTLAIRLYQLDRGHRPKSLSELVPDYLPRLPVDPLAGDGRPLGYLPDAGVPLVYSVGLDGIDNKGQDVIGADGTRDRDRSDSSFPLNRGDFERRPTMLTTRGAAPASAQAVGDQPDVEHGDERDDQRQPPDDQP